jgi:S-DNA-T family DNA segregation ATPase FtsK/SpoIIIE
MSTRREDDSRPKGNVTSQRTTARDVPIAKYKEVPVGTSPPGALRGPSLLPGQGAPERIIPEEVELAVLRSAETLDGPNVARARRRPELPGSPSPTPVSVEVLRVRSVPPGLDELNSTPPSPSGRSIQSGTLMSVGSVDPRAPTELSLPSPRPLSVSERAAYFGPGAVVDRSSPVNVSTAPERQSQPAIESNRLPEVAVRTSSPGFEPSPNSSPRSVPVGSGSPSLRASQPDSVAPPAQNFARPPRSYSPVSPAPSRSASPPSAAEASRVARPGPRSSPDIAPQFQIHSELDALPRELLEDNFDLRSAHTQREPLASRKPQSSSDWSSAHAPVSDRAPGEPMSRPSSRHSTSAMTLLVDRGRESTPPGSAPTPLRRAVVPLSWLLAAAVGVLVALLAVWILHAPSPQDTARVADDRASASAPSAAPVLLPPSTREAAPLVQTARPQASAVSAPALPHPASAALKSPSAPHAADPSLSAPPLPPSAAEASAKARQSIY